MPKWNQNGSKIDQKDCQKSMRKSMRKSMQNGTLKRRVGVASSPPLVVLSRYTLYLFLRLIYQPPTKLSKRPVGTATRMRGRIYGLPPIPPTSDCWFEGLAFCIMGLWFCVWGIRLWVCGFVFCVSGFCRFVQIASDRSR